MEHQAGVRVPGARVEPAGDEHQLGSVAVERRHDDPLEGGGVRAGARARRQRQVDVGRAGLFHPARFRWEAVGLVQGDREDVRVVGECSLRPVAVMGIPVDDRQPRDSVGISGVEAPRARRCRTGSRPSPCRPARGAPAAARARRRSRPCRPGRRRRRPGSRPRRAPRSRSCSARPGRTRPRRRTPPRSAASRAPRTRRCGTAAAPCPWQGADAAGRARPRARTPRSGRAAGGSAPATPHAAPARPSRRPG